MRNQRGIALMVALLVSVVLLLLGTAFLTVASTEHTVARNHYNQARAFWLAEAGLSIGYRTAAQTGPADYGFTISFTEGKATVVILTDSPEPGLFTITSLGSVKNARAEVEAVYESYYIGGGALNLISGPGGISPTFNGESLYISDVSVSDDAARQTVLDAMSPGQNIGAVSTDAPSFTAVMELVNAVRHLATVRLEGNVNTDIGSAEAPVIALAPGSISLAGPSTGYGILLVEGSANIRGSLTWHGLVLVVGDGDLASPGLSGVADVHGQVMVLSTHGVTAATIAGNTRITFEAQDEGAVQSLLGFKRLSWRQLQ